MNNFLKLVLLSALLASCKYDCRDAKAVSMWKYYSGYSGHDCLFLNDSTIFINGQCEILDLGNERKIGNIVSHRKDFWSGNEFITVEFDHGGNTEYIAK